MVLASGVGDGDIVWHSRTYTRCVLFSLDWFDVLGIEMLILSSQILIKGVFFPNRWEGRRPRVPIVILVWRYWGWNRGVWDGAWDIQHSRI